MMRHYLYILPFYFVRPYKAGGVVFNLDCASKCSFESKEPAKYAQNFTYIYYTAQKLYQLCKFMPHFPCFLINLHFMDVAEVQTINPCLMYFTSIHSIKIVGYKSLRDNYIRF